MPVPQPLLTLEHVIVYRVLRLPELLLGVLPLGAAVLLTLSGALGLEQRRAHRCGALRELRRARQGC